MEIDSFNQLRSNCGNDVCTSPCSFIEVTVIRCYYRYRCYYTVYYVMTQSLGFVL